jgi:hypothetical protein
MRRVALYLDLGFGVSSASTRHAIAMAGPPMSQGWFIALPAFCSL